MDKLTFYSNNITRPITHSYSFYVFDMDGTLVDINFGYLQNLFNKIKIDIPKAKFPKNEREFDELIRQIWYEQNRNEIIKEKLEIEPLDFWRVFRRYDSPDNRKNNIIIYQDVSALLKLKERGSKIAVLSDSPVSITELESKAIEEALGNFNFDCVVSVGYDSGRNRKPHFEGLEKCIALLGTNDFIEHSILYTGNSPRADILQAYNYNEYASSMLMLNFEILSSLQVPEVLLSPSAVISIHINPVDSALIIRPQYVMKDVVDKTIYKNNGEVENLKPDFIISSLHALVP